MACKWSIK